MRNENLEQDLGWAPQQYPGYNTFENGEWRIVVDGDAQVGIVYTNYADSAGVLWLKQTDTMMEMRKMFLAGAASGAPASETYGAVTSKFADNLLQVSTGTLDGANATLQAMMQRSN